MNEVIRKKINLEIKDQVLDGATYSNTALVTKANFIKLEGLFTVEELSSIFDVLIANTTTQ